MFLPQISVVTGEEGESAYRARDLHSPHEQVLLPHPLDR